MITRTILNVYQKQEQNNGWCKYSKYKNICKYIKRKEKKMKTWLVKWMNSSIVY